MLKDMKTKSHLKPGQKGTKRLVERFGNSLLCVRYRYDEKRGVRLKTVEIVVEEKPCKPGSGFKDGDIVSVIVAYNENTLREKLKTVGGRWDPNEKLWRIPYGAIRGNAELEDRVIKY